MHLHFDASFEERNGTVDGVDVEYHLAVDAKKLPRVELLFEFVQRQIDYMHIADGCHGKSDFFLGIEIGDGIDL